MNGVLSADWVLPVEGAPIPDGAVAIEGSRIAAVGTVDELGEGTRFDGSVIVPGFVNAHSHLEYAVYGGFGDGLPFAPWILLHIQRKARIGIAETEDIARFGAAECLRSGITTVGDASHRGAAATACDELGLRAVVYIEVFGPDSEQLTTRFGPIRERIAPHLSERVRVGISPHSVYSAALPLWQAAAALGLPIATHFAESEAETQWVRDRSGPFADMPPIGGEPTSIRELAEHRLLSARVIAAHCVKVDAEEIALLAENGVAVAHCPRSNALLGSGIAPLRALREAGVNVGLGTDSPASAPSFDMFDELRAAISATRAREADAAGLGASEALELATLGGARSLGLGDVCGSLSAGKRADLAVLDFADSPFFPWEDPAAAVVFGGTPDRVLLTLVDGEVRYEKGGTDWQELIAAAQHARRALLAAGQPLAERA
jgi:cytosine/adenosine deaminase-related metal-dependent hydrolase